MFPVRYIVSNKSPFMCQLNFMENITGLRQIWPLSIFGHIAGFKTDVCLSLPIRLRYFMLLCFYSIAVLGWIFNIKIKCFAAFYFVWSLLVKCRFVFRSCAITAAVMFDKFPKLN